MGGDQFLGRDGQRLRTADKVGFVIGEEFERRGLHRPLAQPRPQRIGIESGQIEEARGSVAVFQHPTEGRQRKRARAEGLGVARMCGMMRDCSDLVQGVVSAPRAETGRDVTKRIMVVEDNDLNRKLFCDVLKANGFDVEPVADGDSVLETARTCSPDLIIMDIQLPGISGVDLIQAAKRDMGLRAIPVLAVTAFAAKGDEERIRAAGAAGYLSKPVSIMPFMNAVKELLPA